MINFNNECIKQMHGYSINTAKRKISFYDGSGHEVTELRIEWKFPYNLFRKSSYIYANDGCDRPYGYILEGLKQFEERFNVAYALNKQ